jgi:prepilin-type N-terminal cleavage/methylation domain-containing protein
MGMCLQESRNFENDERTLNIIATRSTMTLSKHPPTPNFFVWRDGSSSRGFTLIELVVVMVIIGLLAGLLLPAIQNARESARRIQCQNNLRQVGFGTLQFHDTFGYFPPGRLSPRPGDPNHLACAGEEVTWPAYVFPFLEQTNLAAQWRLFDKWFAHDSQLLETALPVFVCPSRRSLSQATSIRPVSMASGGGRLPCGCPIPGSSSASRDIQAAVSDYAGNHGDLSPGANGLETDFYYGGNGTGILITSRARCDNQRPLDWVDRLRFANVLDGASQTFLIGERHVPSKELHRFPFDGPMYDGGHLPSSMRLTGPGLPIAQGPKDDEASFYAFGSWHRGSSQFVLLDGSVRPVAVSIDTISLGQLANRANSVVEMIRWDE